MIQSLHVFAENGVKSATSFAIEFFKELKFNKLAGSEAFPGHLCLLNSGQLLRAVYLPINLFTYYSRKPTTQRII
jgi:hypothetical protein